MTKSITGDVARMLKDLQPVLKSFGKHCAVGGAVAMAFHGVDRYTKDLDVFAAEAVRNKLLRAIHEQGYRVEPIFEPFHYIARPPWRTASDEARVDILFPSYEPEFSGVVSAEPIAISKGNAVRVFTPLMLALTRVYSTEPRHLTDLAMMLARGVLPVEEIRAALRAYNADDLKVFEKKLKLISKRTIAPKRPKPGSFSSY